MKIALAVFQIRTLGGKERDCLAVAETLMKRGHEVTIVTTAATPEQVARLPLTLIPQRGFSNHGRAAHFAADVKDHRTKARPNVLVAFDRIPSADFFFAADAAAALRLSPLSFWLPRGRTYLRLERDLFENQKTRFFFLTTRQRDEYAALYDFDRSHATVLPVILHDERYLAAAAISETARENFGLPTHTVTAISVAVQPRQKGLDRAMAAIAKFPGIHLVSVGSSDRSLRKQARALGIEHRFHLVPYTPNIMDLIGVADFMVHPARAEAAGQVIAESLLAGRPAIVTGLCGYATEVKREGAGIVLQEPFKQADLDSAVSEMIADLPAMKKAAGKAAEQLRNQQGQWLITIAETIEGSASTSPST
ncbi:MAG: glycosyltransferase family 4 protein [Xanthobacteraceae bacterium]|nr:glycosyltransferase family 4 protein [Xanthobacteraceae bacterium]